MRLANSTEWGLAGYVRTRDLGRAHRVASELVCGNVMVNGAPNAQPGSPFGGVGISGFGREGGRWGLEEFIRTKGVGMIHLTMALCAALQIPRMQRRVLFRDRSP